MIWLHGARGARDLSVSKRPEGPIMISDCNVMLRLSKFPATYKNLGADALGSIARR